MFVINNHSFKCWKPSLGKMSQLLMSMKKITDPLVKKKKDNNTPTTNINDISDRPFTLPSGEFKPKQSLGLILNNLMLL